MRRLLAISLLAFAAACHAQDWTTLSNVDAIVSMNTSAPGTTLTSTIANAGTVCGSNCTVGTNASFAGSLTLCSTCFQVGSYQNQGSNLGAVQLVGGTTYTAQSLNYNNLSHDDSQNNTNAYWQFSGTPGTKTKVAILALVTLGPPSQANGNDWDTLGIWGVLGHYYEAQINNDCPGSNQYGYRIEDQPTAHSACIPVAPQGTYYIAQAADLASGFSAMWIYTKTGTLIGSASHISGSNSDTLRYVQLGNNENGNNTGTFTQYQNLMIQFTSPSSASGSAATVTNGSPTVSGLTGASAAWAGNPISLPNSSVGNTTLVAYTIATCSSSSTCTLTANYSGTTVTGTAAWETFQPMFWTNTALTAGVVAPSRVIDWTAVGVPGGIPTTRTQCVNTQCAAVTTAGTAVTTAQINAALANAPANTYVLLPNGTLSSATSGITFGGASNVTLRGGGANVTFLAPTSASGGGSIFMGTATNNAGSPQNGPVAVTGSTVQGSSTITLATVPNLVVGNPIVLDQLDPTCDNGGIFVNGTGSSYTCTGTSPGGNGPYGTIGGGNGIRGGSGCSASPTGCYHQQQIVEVTQCDGNTTIGHACSSGASITIFPALHMPNWTAIFAWWATSPVQYDAVEDLSVDSTNNSGANGIEIENCLGCWVKGITSSTSSEAHVQFLYSTLGTVRNSYFFLTQGIGVLSYGIECEACSDLLVENNIFHAVTTPMITNGPGSGVVFAYNYTINEFYTGSSQFSIPARGDHASDSDMILTEGNISNGVTADVIHGTTNMETYFRNFSAVQPECWSSGASYAAAVYAACNSGITTMQIYAFHRFFNLIGNVLGTSGTNTTYCNGNNSSTGCSTTYTANNTNVFGLGYGNGAVGTDTNTLSTIMLWGNADPVTGFASPRFNSAEVPTFPAQGTATTSIFGVQLPYLNPAPATNTLPNSFYYASKPSWWPSGKAWPIIGPDVTGGNLLICTGGAQTRSVVTSSGQCPSGSTATAANGEAYSNPAMDCYLNTMSGPANGVTTSILSFNENTCYNASAGAGGATITGAFSANGSVVVN